MTTLVPDGRTIWKLLPLNMCKASTNLKDAISRNSLRLWCPRLVIVRLCVREIKLIFHDMYVDAIMIYRDKLCEDDDNPTWSYEDTCKSIRFSAQCVDIRTSVRVLWRHILVLLSVVRRGPSEVDIHAWYPYFQSCHKYFLDIAQHNDAVIALSACINIRIPFQNEVTITGLATMTVPCAEINKQTSPSVEHVFWSVERDAQSGRISDSIHSKTGSNWIWHI